MIRTINGAIEELRKEDPGDLRCPPLFGHEKRASENPETPDFIGDRERIRTADLPLRSLYPTSKTQKGRAFPDGTLVV